jgi:formate dehydrogenase subunit beta
MSDMQTALRDTVRRLLKDGTVGYVIGWEATRFEDRTKPAFISKPEDADKLVWNKYCINSLAKYALDDRYPDKKIGICVRGCDSRAVNRMIADKQLERENLYLIGLPCDGKMNDVCKTCGHKNPVIYDELIGEPVPESPSADRFAEIEEMEKMTPEERYAFWAAQFDKCIRCYACRNVCPACNCRECYVDQHRVGWQGKQNNRAQNQVYGLTRVYHVGDRCIECGECERVCPMNIPIMRQTKKILKDINELFGQYECGLPNDRTPILGEYDLNDPDDFM